MVLLPEAGEALAQDFLKLEARRSDLEEKRWRFIEEMQNRHTVQEQRRVASLSVLDKRLRTEEKQHCLLKERNVIIRQQAAALCNPGTSEVQQRIRAFRERFALDAERQSMEWNRHIESQLREEIALCRRDAHHCRQRQGEAIEVALQQEKLMVELAEAQEQAQEERAKLHEDVRVQQDRLRQRLFEQRQLMDDRVKAMASGNIPGASQTLKPQDVHERNLPTAPKSPGSPERTVLPMPKTVPHREHTRAGYVPKEGTRQAEVYRRLMRNEAEMAADLRLMEDRLVLRCLHCGFVGASPTPVNGLCENCGHFVEVIRVPPKIAQGSILQSPAKTLPQSTLSSKAFSTKPPPPAFAVRGKTTEVVTQPGGPSLSQSQDPLQAAQELAARSLERLVSRRQQNAVPSQAASPRLEVSDDLQLVSEGLTSPSPEVTSLPAVLTAPSCGLLGDLGVLDTPLPALAPLPSRVNTHNSRPRTMSGNDWYGGSSSSTTPRTPRVVDPAEKAETSSAEDIAFVEEAPDTVGLDADSPGSMPITHTQSSALGPVTQPDQTGCRMPNEPNKAKAAEDKVDKVESFTATPPSPEELDAKEPEPKDTVTARLQDRSADPNKVELLEELDEVDNEGPEDPALQVTSPGSFTFGGMASPPEVCDAQLSTDLQDSQDLHRKDNQNTLPVLAPENSVSVPKDLKTETSEEPRERLAKDTKMMSDLGLDDGSEDDVANKDRSALRSVGKQASKRSNPLSRGRGAGIIQAGESFIGPGAGLSGIPSLSGSKSLGLAGGMGQVSSMANLSKLKAPRKSSQSLLGGPIDWDQKEDFR